MMRFLHTYYGIEGEKSSLIRNIPSYVANNFHYIIVPVNNFKEFNVEQVVLAYYLKEQNERHIGYPLQNIDEEFVTAIDGQRYIVLQVDALQEQQSEKEGSQLAAFHKKYQVYPYEPDSISSYGMWKQLWIDKLTVYEQNLQASLIENRQDYERVWLDVFPYVIGLTENAIQYIGNAEKEHSFDMSDQPTITFERYTNQLAEACFFHYELHFDHPMRDVAEHIRFKLLQDSIDYDEINSFLAAYNRVQRMSPFSWKLLYARLLYPAHFFDRMDMHRTKDGKWINNDIVNLCNSQERYEKRLNTFFQDVKRTNQNNHAPMIQWL